MNPHRTITAALLTLLCTSALLAAEIDSYSIYAAADRKIGTLTTTRDGEAVDVVFEINENGRGPKSKERIVFGKNGLPVSWTLEGQGLAGGPSQETFRYENGESVWDSGAAESGKASGAPKLYVPASASPWAMALYARLGAAAPGSRIEILPAGSLRVSKHGSHAFGAGGKKVTAEVYAVDGLEFATDFLLLDKSGKLFADLGGALIVRDGYEAEIPALFALNGRLHAELQEKMQARLAHRFDAPWHVTNVRVFDPVSASLGPVSTVTVFEDRIVAVAPGIVDKVADGEKLIDGQGGTLMPGLVDMHAHEEELLGYHHLAAGVTTVRDMGNDNGRLAEMVRRQEERKSGGPRIVRAGFLEGKSPFSASAGFQAANLEEAMDALHWYARRGYPYLKIYNSTKEEWIEPLAAEAHRLGMKVLGHVPAFSKADRMIKAGYDEITHINQLLLQYVLNPDEDPRTILRATAMSRFPTIPLDCPTVLYTIELMKTHGVALDTTIATMERLNVQRNGVTPDGDRLHLDHMPLMFQRNRRRDFLPIPDEKTRQAHFKAVDTMLAILGMLHKEGIKLWPGTDDAVAYPIHRELALYVKAGIPAPEVLKIATADAIGELGLGAELGVIARGKKADFILVPANPLEDIESLRLVNLVVQDGTLYFPAEIYRALNVEPFSPAPEIR